MEFSSSIRTKVFISYSHKDARYLKQLQTHLAYYERTGLIDVWDDTKLSPGAIWREEIKNALMQTKVAILLVSATFLASKFIAENELPPLLAAAQSEGAVILPVILSACAFEDTELAQYQAVNSPIKPLLSMSKSDKESTWHQVAKIVKKALNSHHSDEENNVAHELPAGNSLKSIRTKGLGIQTNQKIRQKIKRILFNPQSEVEAPELWPAIALATELDTLGLYNLLKDEDISTLAENQQEQDILNKFLENFIQLQKACRDIDNQVASTIGKITQSSYDVKWDAIHQYIILRLFGWSKEKTEERTVKRIWYITTPDFIAGERVYEILHDDQVLQLLMQKFRQIYYEYVEIRKAILELDGFKITT